MIGYTNHIKLILGLAASVTINFVLKVVVCTSWAFPASWPEIRHLLEHRIDHPLDSAHLAKLASFKVVISASCLRTCPSTWWLLLLWWVVQKMIRLVNEDRRDCRQGCCRSEFSCMNAQLGDDRRLCSCIFKLNACTSCGYKTLFSLRPATMPFVTAAWAAWGLGSRLLIIVVKKVKVLLNIKEINVTHGCSR
jgi:hypothetical protein